MKTVIFVFCLSLLPIAFAYSQSEADAHCNLNLENIFEVHMFKIKYETVQYIYKERKNRFPKNSDFLNGYFELIRGFPLSSKKQRDSVSGVNPGELAKVEWMSEEEIDSYIEQLNCTPEKALNEYRDFIRNIKSKKEIYLKCIDAELAKGGLSEYASAEMTLYGFMPPGWSLTPPPARLSKLDFLKVFKEFIFNNDEDVLPEGARVVCYLSSFADAADWLYDNFENFDRECFLTGTLDDNMGHYQTFTANKSFDEVNDNVKQMFEKDYQFIPDTLICQRITAYRDAENIPLALFIVTLFKNDYPDLRVFRVCSPCPPIRHYGSEIKSVSLIPEDSVCRDDITVELFSSSLAKTVASYYTFDYDNASIVSSGGDMGYRGIINREKK